MEHSFNIELAEKFGIEEAIILHHLFFWISKNAANGKNFYDGSYWTYNSVSAFTKLFPYMNAKKINRILEFLEGKEVIGKDGKPVREAVKIIKKGNYNDNKMNRSCWYAFTDEGLALMERHNYKMSKCNDPICPNAFTQNGEMDCDKTGKCYTDNKQTNDNITNNNTEVLLSSNDDAKIDFDKLKDCFNDELSKANSIIPKIISISGKRRTAVSARVREHGKMALSVVIKKAAASPFLNGHNSTSFMATFDWMIKPANFVKVLEGNYDENINNSYNGNNKADIEKQQRAREVAEAISRRFAADDAAEQTGLLASVQPR